MRNMSVSVTLLLMGAFLIPSCWSVTVKGAGQMNTCGCLPMKKQVGRRSLSQEESQGLQAGEVVVDDMVLTPADLERFQKHVGKSTQKRAANSAGRWPNNYVPYYFNATVPESSRKLMRESWKQLETLLEGCVKIREITDVKQAKNYVNVYQGNPTLCRSKIGFQFTGPQDLALGAICSANSATRQHEFIHTLGFYHEQSRPDRDNHINVVWKNIKTDRCFNFDICTDCETLTPYDVQSIMHYPGRFFTCNGEYTITDKQGKGLPVNEKRELTTLDKQKIRRFYGCEKKA